MADKLINSNNLNKLYSGKTLTQEEWDAYLKLHEPEEDKVIDEQALNEAKQVTEGKTYGMYGTLAKRYCLEDNPQKGARIGKDLDGYLRGVDEAANQMSSVLQEKYLKDERFVSTGNYLEDVRRQQRMNDLIFEEITTSLVYVD